MNIKFSLNIDITTDVSVRIFLRAAIKFSETFVEKKMCKVL